MTLEQIPAKSIVIKTKKPSAWFGFDYNMNIYKGCCHGCIYCDSRSDCYHVEDFDRVRVKKNALEIIRNDLQRKVKRGVVGTGAMSDPYNPFEKKELLTRHALELIHAFDFGIGITTKSDLITRDIDVLQSIVAYHPVLMQITITTPDDSLAAKIEPLAPSPTKRFEAIKKLSNAGIFTGILLMPVLPFISDKVEDISLLVEKAAGCGAKYIYPGFGVTLRQNQREHYYAKLNQIFPESNLTEMYIKNYGNNYSCTSHKAREIWRVFEESCEKNGILYRMEDIIHAYKRPYHAEQLTFFP